MFSPDVMELQSPPAQVVPTPTFLLYIGSRAAASEKAQITDCEKSSAWTRKSCVSHRPIGEEALALGRDAAGG
jgi:hypothetical protein